jgi:uncharacterized repeat protein (TIGR02543 family)
LSAQNILEKQFYYGFDDEIEIIKIEEKALVKTKPFVIKDQYDQAIKKRAAGIKTEWQGENLCKIEFPSSEIASKIIKELFENDEIVCVRNYYMTIDGFEFGLSDEILVKFKKSVKESERENILKKFELQKSKSTRTYEKYCLTKNKDIIRVANELYESGLFEFAYPNLISKVESHGIPNDPYFQFQVALHNTGQTFNGHTGTPNADIDAPEAWDITSGSSNIVIAVIDQGVTSSHPDLPNTRQVRLNGSNLGLGNANDPSPTGNHNHGNACAGIIAATRNNNEGIAGIAPNCKIMPVRYDDINTSDIMTDAIDFAVDNGANIISNSWGYKSTNANLYPSIVTAIQNAIDNGVVVLFSAGNTASHAHNNNGYVAFPANANVDYLIAVGASDRNDQQADYSPTSSLIDVVAPSHRAYPASISGETYEMWSIDMPGNVGYNPYPAGMDNPPPVGEELPNSGTNYLAYTGRFGGTSFSCPEVAGIAALMLSVNPNLTPQQVFNIITSTAEQVGGYNYTGGKSSQMGHGRVNAFLALARAAGGYGVTFSLNGATGTPPPAQIVSPGGYVTMPSPPTRPGYTFGGWYLSSEGSGAPLDLSTYPIHTDRYFYAKWLAPNVTSGIDFIIYNNSSYELYNVSIELIGKLGTNNYFTTFISREPGGISPGTSAGYPHNGDDLSVPGGIGISDIYLNIYARIIGGATVYVRATIDATDYAGTYVNFSDNGNFISDYLGNNYGLSYPAGSFIPYSGRRMLTVTIQNEW